MTSPCPDDDVLLAYVHDELSGAALAAVDKHLEHCEPCVGRLGELEPANPTLAALLRAEEPPPPPDIPGYTYVSMENGSPRLLGRGGLGLVYQATRDRDGRLVAIKFIQVGTDQSALQRVRFVREVEAALALSDDNASNGIVRAFDVGTAGGRLYYVMEFIRGENLFDYLHGLPLQAGGPAESVREVARWAVQLAEAIRHAHDNGIVHRDLKPSNVMVELDDEGRPLTLKITDFGMARRIQVVGHHSHGQPVGTLVYMAPEQLKGGPSLSPTVDVYGLGAILYYLLTGRPLFDPRRSSPDLIQALPREEPVPPRRLNSAVPYHLETIVLKCLRKRATDRYESCDELIADLRLFLAGKRPRARRRTRVDRALSWARNNPGAVASLSVISVLLALSLWLAVLSHFRKNEAEASAGLAREHEAKAQEQAFARLLDAARFALGRGQLTVALPLFDEAIAAAPPEQRAALEVERLRCLFAYRTWDRLHAELERLGGRDDLPAPLRAQVLLHQGDVGLWSAELAEQSRARDQIQTALAMPGALSPADAAYARALIDEGTVDAVGHFEEALRHDRFHPRANAALLLELVLSGQFERARGQGEFMAAVSPDEPVTPLGLAIVATLQEDAAARKRHLARLEQLIADRQRMAILQALFQALDVSIRHCREMHGPNQGPQWLRALRMLGGEQMFLPDRALAGLRQGLVPLKMEGVPSVVGVGLPVLARPIQLVEMLNRAYKQLGDGDAAGAAALLEREGRQHPEALLRLLHATAHLRLAQQLEAKRDRLGCLLQSRRAHQLAEEAAEAPTLVPFGPYRHNARWMCLMIEAAWGVQSRVDTAGLAVATLALAGTNPFAGGAVLTAGEARLRAYPVRRERRHLLRVAADSGPYDEARSDLLPSLLRYFDTDDARLLLTDWASDAPNDPAPYRLGAAFERDRGDLTEALRWIQRGLSVHPGDRELRDALKRLRPR